MKTIRTICVILFLVSSFSVLSQTVHITKTGEKYHKKTCRYLKYSHKELSIQQAIQLGYKACKVCKPSVKQNAPEKTTNNNSLTESTAPNPLPSKKIVATQCIGKTKAGKRCKRKTKNSNGRCFQH